MLAATLPTAPSQHRPRKQARPNSPHSRSVAHRPSPPLQPPAAHSISIQRHAGRFRPYSHLLVTTPNHRRYKPPPISARHHSARHRLENHTVFASCRLNHALSRSIIGLNVAKTRLPAIPECRRQSGSTKSPTGTAAPEKVVVATATAKLHHLCVCVIKTPRHQHRPCNRRQFPSSATATRRPAAFEPRAGHRSRAPTASSHSLSPAANQPLAPAPSDAASNLSRRSPRPNGLPLASVNPDVQKLSQQRRKLIYPPARVKLPPSVCGTSRRPLPLSS